MLLLSACDTIPVRGDEEQGAEKSTEQSDNVQVIPLEDLELDSGFDTGEQAKSPEESIRADLREALDSPPPFRQTAYLDAVHKLIDKGDLQDAEAVLNKIDVRGLAPVHRARKRLLRAEISFQEDNLDRAMRLVERSLRAQNIDPTYVSRGMDLKARIDLLQGQPLDAAKAWIGRGNLLTDAQAIDDNHNRIWFALGHLNGLELQLAGQVGAADELRGWLDIAILFLEFVGDRHGLRSAVTQWINANSFHPAVDFTTALLPPLRTPEIRQVALLLPLSSNFGTAAQRVYNGFYAGHHTDTDPRRPNVVFYDVGGEPSLAGNYVGVAASDGANVIVGPLGRSAVNALLESRQPEKPIVLLGGSSTEYSLATGSYQFDLAPESEAKQVAEFMYASGHRRLATLYPNDEWGRRIYDAFVGHWETLGGTLAESQPYAPASDDFTVPINKLFNLTESENRKAFLQAKSRLNLHFDARRRRDIDALFMAARPDEARLLKPQINFFQGHDLPVYSTSHVYTGAADTIKDTDLDGIMFPDMPWTIANTARIDKLKTLLKNAGFTDVSSELFAFGYGSYQLALLAARPPQAGDTRLNGLTSELIIGKDGRVHRHPEWAKFIKGVPARIWTH